MSTGKGKYRVFNLPLRFSYIHTTAIDDSEIRASVCSFLRTPKNLRNIWDLIYCHWFFVLPPKQKREERRRDRTKRNYETEGQKNNKQTKRKETETKRREKIMNLFYFLKWKERCYIEAQEVANERNNEQESLCVCTFVN